MAGDGYVVHWGSLSLSVSLSVSLCLSLSYVLLITRPVIIEYAYNEGNLWVPNALVLYNH